MNIPADKLKEHITGQKQKEGKIIMMKKFSLY